MVLMDLSWGIWSINYPHLTEISVHVACEVTPEPQQRVASITTQEAWQWACSSYSPCSLEAEKDE